MPGDPYLVRWTAHALAKVEILGIDRTEIERAILEYDHVRRQKPGAADWRINAGRLVIVYQHPDQGVSTSRPGRSIRGARRHHMAKAVTLLNED